MTQESTYWRQMDILSPAQLENVEIVLIGAGGIGSATALALAKMGVQKMTVYDPDTIEEHNLPNQMYPEIIFMAEKWGDSISYPTIGKNKADVLQQVIEEWSSTIVTSVVAKYEEQPLKSIVISGVDSMSARRTIWDGVKQNKEFVDLYIEARMGAEVGMVYAVNPKNADQCAWYESMLYDDAAAIEIPCTARAIIYNTFMLASLICSQVKKYIRQEPVYREIVMDIGNVALIHSGGVV